MYDFGGGYGDLGFLLKKKFSNLKLFCTESDDYCKKILQERAYTNFENLIMESHKEACQKEPIFFNNTQSGVKSYFKKVYETASVIYSPEFQRTLIPYAEVLDTFNFNSKCDVIGISGQGPETVFKSQLTNDINIESVEISSRLADGCNKSGCGVIWYIDQLSLE